MPRPLLALRLVASGALFAIPAAAQGGPPKYFISVDMEGIGGIGTPAMTGANGKDYPTSRRLMTDEVNTVVRGILARGPAEILVNDSHGDMQNLIHTDLDPRVTYIQGSIKPLGMVEGLDASYSGAFFLGYHARAGTPVGFLAHTGSGAVKGLWLNNQEVGEGELNAAYAGSLGVRVLMVAGDSTFVTQFTSTVATVGVVTKVAVTPQSARLFHPDRVRSSLAEGVNRALDNAGRVKLLEMSKPILVRLRLADVTTPQILLAIPGVKQIDGFTVEVSAPDMASAYRLIRLMYRFVSI